MKNREYLEKLNDQKLASLIKKGVFEHKIRPEDICRGACRYADAKGFCTHFDQAGNVDCPWTIEERIVNWLNAEKGK